MFHQLEHREHIVSHSNSTVPSEMDYFSRVSVVWVPNTQC